MMYTTQTKNIDPDKSGKLYGAKIVTLLLMGGWPVMLVLAICMAFWWQSPDALAQSLRRIPDKSPIASLIAHRMFNLSSSDPESTVGSRYYMADAELLQVARLLVFMRPVFERRAKADKASRSDVFMLAKYYIVVGDMERAQRELNRTKETVRQGEEDVSDERIAIYEQAWFHAGNSVDSGK